MLFSIFNGNKGILLIDLAGDLLFEKEGSLGLLLCFSSFFFCRHLIQLAIFQMAHYGTFLSALTHSSEDPTTAWCSLPVNRHPLFYMLP